MPLSNGSGSYTAVLWIHDILLWIRIRGSHLWLMDPDLDPDPSISSLTFFCLLGTFLKYITRTSFFKDKKSKPSHKTVGIKVFLTIFAWWQKDSDPNLWLEDTSPDPGGSKTYGSDGSGSATTTRPFSKPISQNCRKTFKASFRNYVRYQKRIWPLLRSCILQNFGSDRIRIQTLRLTRFVFKSYPLTGRRMKGPHDSPEKEWKHMIQEYGKSDTSEVHKNTKKRQEWKDLILLTGTS